METIYKKARAKINLTLNVLGKREDGYHELETIFQKISLYDELKVTKTDKHDSIRINTNIESLQGEGNIIFKAYQNLKDRFLKIGGVDVDLKKNIPMQAGLAGGSTDCGAFIESMNKLFDLKLSKKEMVEIGANLGADVPQSLYNTPIIARGIGEKIKEIKSNAKYYVLVIKPQFKCNTKEMFQKLDNSDITKQRYNTENMKKALEKGNTLEISSSLYNVFEIALEKSGEIKQEIIKAGAKGSLMSGSGSTFFGIFENKEQAKKGFKELSKKYETFYCISYTKFEK